MNHGTGIDVAHSVDCVVDVLELLASFWGPLLYGLQVARGDLR